MIPLYLARDLLDAQLLMDKLEDAGISASIHNADPLGAVGELPWGTRPEVCVLQPADLERAVTIKQQYESTQALPLTGEERRCPACGELSPPNFELCWRCRKPFT